MRRLVLMVAAGLVLLAAEARVRLNSIRTLVLADGLQALNRSLELTLHPCMSDLECAEGSYCHGSTAGPAHSRCRACRRRKRRCQRDSMCCPGNHCSGGLGAGVCVPDAVVSAPPSERKRKRKRASGKARAGDSCLRSPDCSPGLCCARHFWTRICKAVLREGQVCSQRGRGLELFQRCPCGGGLSCRASSSSSPSSLLAAAAAKFGRSSSPHRPTTRLHVCQKE